MISPLKTWISENKPPFAQPSQGETRVCPGPRTKTEPLLVSSFQRPLPKEKKHLRSLPEPQATSPNYSVHRPTDPLAFRTGAEGQKSKCPCLATGFQRSPLPNTCLNVQPSTSDSALLYHHHVKGKEKDASNQVSTPKPKIIYANSYRCHYVLP